jgi:FtsZ-interacting cell division protein ZipA
LASDAKGPYDKIQLGVSLQDVYTDDSPGTVPAKMERYITELKRRFKSYGPKVEIKAAEPIADAIAKAKKRDELYKQFNLDEVVLLKSDKPLKGTLVWDVLQSVGLKWGDGDLFHWLNPRGNYGADELFSVWTTTDPGYFLPEQVQAGRMNPSDLVFGFSVPRNADPERVFEVMVNAAKYCQKRLGGQLLNKNQQPFNQQDAAGQLSALIKVMKAQGITPGSDKALGLF